MPPPAFPPETDYEYVFHVLSLNESINQSILRLLLRLST